MAKSAVVARTLEQAPSTSQASRSIGSDIFKKVANGVVIVPQFDDPNDKIAVDALQAAFPDRQIRGLYAVDLVWGLGAYHCITHEQPA